MRLLFDGLVRLVRLTYGECLLRVARKLFRTHGLKNRRTLCWRPIER